MTVGIEHIPLLCKLGMTHNSAQGQADAVARHLQRLLNTRKGEALANAEYGLVDLVDLLSELPHTADQIGHSIERCIRQFEPRLRVHAVRLNHDAPRHTLQFCIEASLIGASHQPGPKARMQLSAKLDAHGHIEVAR